ncbi:DUF308 domain-containing protein [Methanothermobacter thermautotrophicus]|jgi:uncharacterized membrane protein HdeD (DUF308 family)|uniref:Acid-resistance membrane protein n=2 Tax=Methanothermobacter thermautotrophicus TaxID=145262 RepID=O26967_METTH|nr:unknown [Methanothermobacter thermautotrophicus str. Delta H]BAZ98914.1 hypothetical protein tca_00846 [Methanothermobacter sp. EMTCatA1]
MNILQNGEMMLKKGMGLLSVILGIVFLVSPVSGVTAISILTGLVLSALGVWMLANAIRGRRYMEVGVLWMVFAVITLAVGLMLAFRVFLINELAGAWLYVTGILLLVAAMLILSAGSQSYLKRNAGIMSAIFGVIYILMAALSFNPVFVGLAVGVILIVYGVAVLRSP